MMQPQELQREQRFAARVQQLLSAAIDKAKGFADEHMESIRLMLVDAWEELRLKPTALSPKDLEQLSQEVHHFLARHDWSKENERQYQQMLLNPFFARIDFQEAGNSEVEKIVIGLYSLTDPATGERVVYDWRAPVCSLYYDSLPGEVAYNSPSGVMRGKMLLKRQYKMENGRLVYYIDTEVSIDDEILLDILSGATTNHMRQIVSTIQKEQNAAVRYDNVRLLCVVGAAGSGKTSVAMHRAAYLLYRYRDSLDAKRIVILSPSSAFSEYISTVLPELGEENTRSATLSEVFSGILGQAVEPPLQQVERLMEPGYELRRASVRYKSGAEFLARLRAFCQQYREEGPEFADVKLEERTLMDAAALRALYREEFRLLAPALRILRIQTVLEQRLEAWSASLEKQYSESLSGRYKGKDLAMAVHMAVTQRLHPVRSQIRRMLEIHPLELFAQMMRGAPEELAAAARENAQAKCVWWEDAGAIAYIMLDLGFAAPDRGIRHMIVDEAQDYADASLAALALYYPEAQVTLLGDPKQRTCPGMPPCAPENWGACFQVENAPLLTLGRCYRSSLPIARFLNALLPDGDQIVPFGREGVSPELRAYTEADAVATVQRLRGAYHRVAVVTRTTKMADRLSRRIEGAYLLDGGDDALFEATDVAVGCYHVMKGMEFDAVVVAWPEEALTDGERRRLYTACSRALHHLVVLTTPEMIEKLGIVL